MKNNTLYKPFSRALVLLAIACATAEMSACRERKANEPTTATTKPSSAAPSADSSLASTGVTTMPATFPHLDELRKKYAGRIKPGITGGRWKEYSAAMEQLLNEWNPVGHTVEEVTHVIGPPVESRDSTLYYPFDSGRYGIGWRMKVKK